MVNYNENLYERRGIDGRSHIPALPLWFSIIRTIQLLFAFLVLVFTAYAGSVYGTSFSETLFPGYSMAYFTFPWTLLFLVYVFLAPFFFPRLYHYWIHLGLEFLTTIFWLTTFALLANELPLWKANADAINYANAADNNPDIAQIEQEAGVHFGSVFGKENSAIGTSRAAVAFSALEWLSFMATLGLFAFFIHRHRIANGAAGFGGFGTRSGATHNVEKPQPGVELRGVQEEQHTEPAV